MSSQNYGILTTLFTLTLPSQGPRHTKDVIKVLPVVPLFSTEH